MHYNLHICDLSINIKIDSRLRMSEPDINESPNSFLTNFKNKISYKLQEAVYDPKANEFVKKRQEKLEKEKEKKSETNQEMSTKNQHNNETTVNEGDPNTFSGKRLGKKIYNQFVQTIKSYILPFIALMIAMIVANEMIVYAVPIRIIFFIFTLLIIIFYPIASIGFPIFYLLKGGYSYYINTMTDKPQRIMPTIYSLLPVTTYQPTSKLGSLLLYPFTYPKTIEGEKELPKIIDEYWNSLIESFPGYDMISSIPLFQNNIKKAKEFVDGINKLNPPQATESDIV